jgi:hypothetical protein
MTMLGRHALTLLFVALTPSSFGCIIHKTDSGICTNKYLPSSNQLDAIARAKALWMADMPYYGRWIANYYSPCEPARPAAAWTAPDANFPDGRLGGSSSSSSDDGGVDVHSIRAKDSWVERTVTSAIQSRIDIEMQHGSKHHRYLQNDDCQEANASYTCWMNFPRCSDDFNESLPMCQSACENMFRVRGFASDIWRCQVDVVDGDEKYDAKAFFPGQPFARNSDSEGKAVCTPSIKGAGSSLSGYWSHLLLGIAFLYYSRWM